jgi:hypothetical protein
VKKTTLAALIGSIFPGIIGPGNNPTIPALGAMPDIGQLGAAILSVNPFQETNYNVAANTAAFTLTGPQISGAAQNFLNLSGVLGAGAALTLPTVAALLLSMPPNVQANPVGISFQLRILNPAGTQTWTVTTNTGWTLTGTMTVPTTTWRDFVVQITSATTATIQAVGAGVAP